MKQITTQPEILAEDQPIDQRIVIFEKSLPVLQKAGAILLSNQDRVSKALTRGRWILNKIQEEGMTDEVDAMSMEYLSKAGKALDEIKEARKGVTQIAGELSKLFTTLEAQIDPKKNATITAQIQEARNAYAKKNALEKAQAEEQARKEAEKKTARINLKYQAINEQTDYYMNHLTSKKKQLLDSFNSTTLETYDAQFAKFEWFVPIYNSDGHFSAFKSKILYPENWHRLFKEQELWDINTEVLTNERLKEFSDNYTAEISLLRQDILDKFPSKKAELEEIKRKADEAEKERLAELERQREAARLRQETLDKQKDEQAKATLLRQQEDEKRAEQDRLDKLESDRLASEKKTKEDQEAREEAERRRIETEDADARTKAQVQADVAKGGEETMTLFEEASAIAEITGVGQTRQGYEIQILHHSAWVQIFTLWYQKIGKDLDNIKTGKTSLDQMKSFCEKEAHKTGEKIVGIDGKESKVLVYEPTFTAINKKVK